MNEQNLQQMMSEDIQLIKTLDLDMMPANDYYKANLSLFVSVFLKMYLTVIAAVIVSSLLHWNRSDEGLVFEELLLTCGGAFLLTGFIFFFIYDLLNNYVIFYHQIRSKLQLGERLDQQMKRVGRLAYTVFAVVVVVPTLLFNPMSVLIAEFAAFFVSGIAAGLLIEMEMKRVGISRLLRLIRVYFDKNKDAIQQAKGR